MSLIVDRVIYDLNNPYSRRIIVNMYNHADLNEMNLYPCAYSVTFNVTGNKLNAILNQRSQDILVANNWNVSPICYFSAHVCTGKWLKSRGTCPCYCDAHIYDRYIPLVEELNQKDSL